MPATRYAQKSAFWAKEAGIEPHLTTVIPVHSKIIATTCHAPVALIEAKYPNSRPFLKEKKLTAFSNAEEAKENMDKVSFNIGALASRLLSLVFMKIVHARSWSRFCSSHDCKKWVPPLRRRRSPWRPRQVRSDSPVQARQ